MPTEVIAERFERLRAVVERSALRKHRARVGRLEEVLVEGPSKRDPEVTTGRTAPEQARPLRRPGRPAPGQRVLCRVMVTGAARHHLTGDLVEVTARPVTDPVPDPPCAAGSSGLAVALVGPTASGKSAIALAAARAARGGPAVELVSVDSMAVYRGMDLGTAKPPPESGPRSRTTSSIWSTPTRSTPSPGSSRTPGRPSPASPTGGGGRCWWGAPACTSGRSPTTWPSRALARRWPPGWTSSRPGPPEPGGRCSHLHARLAGLDPVAASRIEPGNDGGWCGPSRSRSARGRPFSSFGPGLERYPRHRVTMVGVRRDPEDVDRRIGARFGRLMDDGLLDEVRKLAARPGGLSRTARQALGYRELLAHVEDGAPAGRSGRRGGPAYPGPRPTPAGLVPPGPPHRVGRRRRRPGGGGGGPGSGRTRRVDRMRDWRGSP